MTEISPGQPSLTEQIFREFLERLGKSSAFDERIVTMIEQLIVNGDMKKPQMVSEVISDLGKAAS